MKIHNIRNIYNILYIYHLLLSLCMHETILLKVATVGVGPQLYALTPFPSCSSSLVLCLVPFSTTVVSF